MFVSNSTIRPLEFSVAQSVFRTHISLTESCFRFHKAILFRQMFYISNENSSSPVYPTLLHTLPLHLRQASLYIAPVSNSEPLLDHKYQYLSPIFIIWNETEFMWTNNSSHKATIPFCAHGFTMLSNRA